MATATISPKDLASKRNAGGKVDVLDVRTPVEYREVHCEGARNVPLSDLDPIKVMANREGAADHPLYVICKSGSRGRQACEKFHAAGFPDVVNVEGGTTAWVESGLPVVRGKKAISLERQVRIGAGSLVLVGVVLGYFVHPLFAGLSAFVGAGLVFSGLTDTCGMGMVLARMPWNRVAALIAGVMIVTATGGPVISQEKSVKPGINEPFKNPVVAEWVTKFEGESRETFEKRKEVVAACKLKPGVAIADVGAGTGMYTRLFAEAVGKEGTVYAVDISRKFLDHIAESAKNGGFGNVKTILGKDQSAELPDASVDLVFICDTYHHFEFPSRMMTSIHKALKPGGRVVIVDFIRIPGKSSDWVMGHVRAGQEVVEKEIGECGFKKVAEVKDLLKDNFILVFEKATSGSKDK